MDIKSKLRKNILWNWPHLRVYCDLMYEASDEIELFENALKKIACYDDEQANEKLARTGSHAGFDEPASVQIARDALEMSSSEIPAHQQAQKDADALFEDIYVGFEGKTIPLKNEKVSRSGKKK